MVKFSPEELIQYLYGECDAQMETAIKEALDLDWTLREKFAVLKASVERLDKLTEAPRTEVVLNILNYAREKSAEIV